eukprot:CAMPEP_0174703018 /NCGR_PEP_ID=MMETSP1094-20130205/7114_1 /TAXON_ID=156173 /ORGANISM="Chrysochromulina brevifilum, Strain UTEX LB 985" /LENGTH=292 /DNA_ID=CAMNT_0015900881 /DNA_START=167 /DNA_END=1045 /DNA_ORIENTATION=-
MTLLLNKQRQRRHDKVLSPPRVNEARFEAQRCESMAVNRWDTFQKYASGELHIKSRADFAWLLAASGVRGAAVEIGVAEGGFSALMLKEWEGCTAYHQIDPWGTAESNTSNAKTMDMWKAHREITMISLSASQKAYCEVVTEFSDPKYGGKVQQHRMGAGAAASTFLNESLSFIYVDGNHYYSWVKEDIMNYWPKLEPGGLMAGHDYFWPVSGGGWTENGGVQRAVQEFAESMGVRVHLTNNMAYPPCCPSWYVFKPPTTKHQGHHAGRIDYRAAATFPAGGTRSECKASLK